MNGKKLRELLALLTYYHGAPKTKRQLAFELWPDSSAERARDCLYKVLRDLRRLGQRAPLPVRETREGIYLELTNRQSDLSLFQRWSHSGDPAEWKRAFELYRGGFLDKEGYEWAAVAHSYYEVCYFDLLRALAGHCLSAGREPEANYFQKLADQL
nr:hypothetical protein [uncultured Oscillibacter sp.]